MLNRRHFLLFVFMLIPTPGATSTDYELAQCLIGQWFMTYTIPQFEEEPELYLYYYSKDSIK